MKYYLSDSVVTLDTIAATELFEAEGEPVVASAILLDASISPSYGATIADMAMSLGMTRSVGESKGSILTNKVVIEIVGTDGTVCVDVDALVKAMKHLQIIK